MKVFYSELMRVGSISSALRQTMRHIRSLHPNPYYWAPFVLIGDAESPVFPEAGLVDAGTQRI
jgi:CHAT domain-containing protein